MYAGTLLAVSFTLVKVVCVATYEEVLIRGYLLRNLAEGLNVPIAVVSTSALFAVLQLTNDNASLLSTIGLFVNRLLFAAALQFTGRLSTIAKTKVITNAPIAKPRASRDHHARSSRMPSSPTSRPIDAP